MPSSAGSSSKHLKGLKTAKILSLESDLEACTKKASFNINALFTDISLADETSRELSNTSGNGLEEKRAEVAVAIDEADKLDYQCFLSVR
jgi:hypothetical protein